MKPVIILMLILASIGGIFCFCLFPFVAALILLLFLVGIFLYTCRRTKKLRRQWLQSPVLPDSPQFEDLFWNLTLHNQDWYIEHILKEEGVEQLIRKYENTVREIWNNHDCDISEKLDQSSLYTKRLRSLSFALEFYNLQRC